MKYITFDGSFFLIKKLFVMAFLPLLSTEFVHAQWVKTTYPSSVPYGIYITTSGNLIVSNYAINPDAGLHVSYDQGQTWETPDVPALNFTSFFEAEGYIFAGGTDGTLVRTKDEGKTWETFRFNSLFEFENAGDAYGLIYHHGKLYVGVWKEGVFYSDDLGETWHSTDNHSLGEGEESGRELYSLASYKDNLYLIGAGGRWKLNEQDDTWNYIDDIYDEGFIDGNRMYVYSTTPGSPYCMRYTENGKNWTDITPPVSVQDNSARFMKIYNGVIFAGFFNVGVFYSLDEGKNWTDISDGISIIMDLGDFKFYDVVIDFAIFNDEMYCTCYDPTEKKGGGVYKMARPADFIHSYSDDNSIKVYPDAQTDYLYLHYDPSVKAVLQVTDVYGKEWIDCYASEKVNIQNLPSGVYVYSLRVNEERITGKFIKK